MPQPSMKPRRQRRQLVATRQIGLVKPSIHSLSRTRRDRTGRVIRDAMSWAPRRADAQAAPDRLNAIHRGLGRECAPVEWRSSPSTDQREAAWRHKLAVDRWTTARNRGWLRSRRPRRNATQDGDRPDHARRTRSPTDSGSGKCDVADPERWPTCPSSRRLDQSRHHRSKVRAVIDRMDRRYFRTVSTDAFQGPTWRTTTPDVLKVPSRLWTDIPAPTVSALPIRSRRRHGKRASRFSVATA